MSQSYSNTHQSTIAALCGLLLISGSALQAAPPSLQVSPGVVDRPPVELPPKLSGDDVDVAPREPMQPPAADDRQVVATLTDITFTGDVLLKEADLDRVAAPFLGRAITARDIARLKYELTSLYYREGYVLVKVTTPPQQLADGVLDVVVIAGRIGEINVDNEVLFPPTANSRIKAISSGDVFNERQVETALQDINTLTNIDASVSLRPGRQAGTTDLDLLVSNAPESEDVQIFSIDNYGSKFTGQTVSRLTLQKSNWFGRGESFSLTGRKSNDEFWSIQGEGLFPLPIHNLQFEIDVLTSDNSIGDVFAALDSSGESEVWQAAISSALINQRQRKLVVRGGIERGEYKSFLAGVPDTSDRITKLFAESSFSLRKSRAVSFASLRVSKGVGVLGADEPGEADASRILGTPDVAMLEALLYTNARLTDRNYLSLALQGQHAADIVLSSDLFTVGGYGTVRGYEPGQSTGDSGAALNADLYRQFNIEDSRWYAQAGPFFDWGYVHNRVAGSTLENNISSAGIGVEFNYRHNTHLVSKLRLDWARPLRHRDLPDVDSSTFYARFTQLF